MTVEFQAGDKVTVFTDAGIITGTVHESYEDFNYPLRILGSNGYAISFTAEGFTHKDADNRNVYHGWNIKIIGEEIPNRVPYNNNSFRQAIKFSWKQWLLITAIGMDFTEAAVKVAKTYNVILPSNGNFLCQYATDYTPTGKLDCKRCLHWNAFSFQGYPCESIGSPYKAYLTARCETTNVAEHAWKVADYLKTEWDKLSNEFLNR